MVASRPRGRHTGARGGRCAALLTLCALGAVLSTLTFSAPASAQCEGLNCLPTTGYTIEGVFNCGQIHSYETCYATGTKSYSSATQHTYGFGSASYSGEGNAEVWVAAERGDGTDAFGMVSFGNLARACYYESCVDQDIKSLILSVGTMGYHTISGHWEA